MKLKKLIWGFPTTIVLLIILTISMITATFIESGSGTDVARRWFYHSIWFETLLTLVAINLTGSMFFFRSFSLKKISVPLFHLAFILILTGAFFTHHYSIDATVYIREGESTNKAYIDEQKTIDLPFEIELTDFVLERYPGSHSPSSYSSFVKVIDSEKNKSFDYHIYMNHILKYRGWRFFQTSYDNDEKGTILTATHDTLGTTITYIGYALAILLMIASLFMPDSFFRRQLRSLKKTVVVIALITIPAVGFSITLDKDKVIDSEQAKKFGELIVQDNKGRMKPMNTLNKEFMRKIYGKESYCGLTADQFVLSIVAFPEYWNTVPVIVLKDDKLKEFLNAKGKYIPFNELFDKDGNYKLGSIADKVFMKSPETRNQSDKAIIRIDENANIFHQFITLNGFCIFPVEGTENNKWHTPAEAANFTNSREDSLFLKNIFTLYLTELASGTDSHDYKQADRYYQAMKTYQQKIGKAVYPSQSKIKAELLYNHLNLFARVSYLLFAAGITLLILFFLYITSNKPFPARLLTIFQIISILLVLILATGVGLRWFIGGYIPVSNSYEVMIFLSGVVIITGLLFSRKEPVILALSLILSFTFLLVSLMNNANPEIGNLVPVLKSYWLSIHVAVITSSYALFALAMMLSLVNLVIYSIIPVGKFSAIEARTQQTGVFMQLILIPGVYLLTIGTILGAVWANESWGTYWGWDPKETWALISIIVYALVGHLRLIPSIKEQLWSDLATFWAFTSVLMTFFGVNYLLSGMHSYAGNEKATLPLWIIIATVFFILLSLFSSYRYFRLKGK